MLAGIAAALLLLLTLAVIGAALVVVLVVTIIGRILDRFGHQRAGWAWDGGQVVSGSVIPEECNEDLLLDDLEESPPIAWSYSSPLEASVSGPGGVESVPEIVIIGGRRADNNAAAEGGAFQQTAAGKQMWTIHPDHTAHWQDEAGDCQWCRDEAASLAA